MGSIQKKCRSSFTWNTIGDFMTREEYFVKLKNNIQSLSLDEQNEALQYYSDYFDEACDDEKAMSDLGTPEEVAALIREKCSNALVKKEEKKSENKEKAEGSFQNNALYFCFEPSCVKNINFAFGAVQVVLISGQKYEIETRGLLPSDLECYIDNNGTLVLKNAKKVSKLNFWSHDKTQSISPRILITLPTAASVQNVKITLGAGTLTSKSISLNYERALFEVGAGKVDIDELNANRTDIRCGMGKVGLRGNFNGSTNIDCGMGNVKIVSNQNAFDCSYDAHVGLGSFRFNDFSKGGIGNCQSDERKFSHFSINVGMGDVSVFTK